MDFNWIWNSAMGIKAFFSFWPSDKMAILYLMGAITIGFGAPFVYKNYIYEPREADFTEFSEEISAAMERIKQQELLAEQEEQAESEEEFFIEGYHQMKIPKKKRKLKPRKFNPNTFTKADAREIGLSEFVIGNIASFREKGYTYKTKENFLETYGLEPNEKEQLYEYVDLPTDFAYQKAKQERQAKYEKRKREAEERIANESDFAVVAKEKKPYPKKPIKEVVVDINTADEAALQEIRGIGEVYAVEIVEFREKLGAFTSIEQVKDVPMMRDSIFQIVKDQFTLSEKPIKQININDADIATLKAHPYISYKIAKSIVALRKQHGSFTQLEQLKKSKLISDEAFNAMKPYLSLE